MSGPRQSRFSRSFVMTDRAEVKVLPPFVLLPVLEVQVILWAVAPVHLLPGSVALPFGLAVVAGSIALAILGAREIVRAGTAFDARKATTALVDLRRVQVHPQSGLTLDGPARHRRRPDAQFILVAPACRPDR